MAIILSLETSTDICSVALHKDGKILSYVEIHIDKSHAEKITILIDSITRYANIPIPSIDAIAISKGPGSYTGLRVGTSTAKGLAMAIDKPLIAINTLQSMAFEVNQFNVNDYILCPMLDARRMEVYCASFDSNLNYKEDTNARILTENSFEEILEKSKVLFFGNGSDKFKGLTQNSNAQFITGIFPKASYIGKLAHLSFMEGKFEELHSFEPFYLKDFVSFKPNS